MIVRPRRLLAAVVAGGVLLGPTAACSSVLDRPSLPTAGPADTRTGAPPKTTTAASITPVTPDGLLTGPGVTDDEISLAVLAGADRDRGFNEGVRLWQRSVNTSGGLCGRTIELRANGADGIPADPAEAYRSVGTSVLGLLTLPPATSGDGAGSTASSTSTTTGAIPSDGGDATGRDVAGGETALAASIAADQVPAVAPTGTSAQLGPTRPMVVGATADILTINGLDYLLRAGMLRPGDEVGVLTDGSATALDALHGARWWAQENGLDLDVRENTAAAGWTAGVVLVPSGASAVASLITDRPAVSVLTLLDGFDPGSWSADAATAAAGRVYVATPAPAYGSDYPAAVAVSSMAAAVGATTPGPRTLDGYATGATWGRLIGQACADRSLTRAGIWTAATTVGPAPSTSLFGAADPGLPIASALPATRVSSVSVVDAAAPTGLRPLIALESASGIADYQP